MDTFLIITKGNHSNEERGGAAFMEAWLYPRTATNMSQFSGYTKAIRSHLIKCSGIDSVKGINKSLDRPPPHERDPHTCLNTILNDEIINRCRIERPFPISFFFLDTLILFRKLIGLCGEVSLFHWSFCFLAADNLEVWAQSSSHWSENWLLLAPMLSRSLLFKLYRRSSRLP